MITLRFFHCWTLNSFRGKDFNFTGQKFRCGNMTASNLHIRDFKPGIWKRQLLNRFRFHS